MGWSPRHSAALLIAWGALAAQAGAHEGPPFPIITDGQAGPYTVSVWSDPDVGVGTFYVIFGSDTEVPADTRVQVCVRPTSGRLEESCHPTSRQDMRDRTQFYGEVPFDQQEMWRIRVRVTGSGGTGEVTTEVEVTPPGFGPWDLLLYGFPFALFGALWIMAALRRRRRAPRATPPPDAGGTSPAGEAPVTETGVIKDD